MTTTLALSDDQASAYDAVTDMLRSAGIDLDDALLMPPKSTAASVMAITGKAGSGKTLLLAELYKALEAAGVDIVSGDYEPRKKRDKRTLAILAPTNKAASVLRFRGVPAIRRCVRIQGHRQVYKGCGESWAPAPHAGAEHSPLCLSGPEWPGCVFPCAFDFHNRPKQHQPPPPQAPCKALPTGEFFLTRPCP